MPSFTQHPLRALAVLVIISLALIFHPFQLSSPLLSTAINVPVTATAATQVPFVADQVVFTQKAPKRVAIIGAGASGSSAAFFINRAARVAERRAGLNPGELLADIVVYEREAHVGGRSYTVFPHGDSRLRAVEVGASIFVAANRNLMKAAKLFGLNPIEPGFGDSGVGIWDGEQILFSTSASKSHWSNWWDSISAVRRYGALSPWRQSKAVSQLLNRFKNLYDGQWLAQRGTVNSIEQFASTVDLGVDLTTRTGADWAKNIVGVNDRWMNELMEGSTRVNYARDMPDLHALGAGVSLATGGASQIDGGNWRLFAGMLNASGADVRLKTEVAKIVPLHENIEGVDPAFRVITNTSTEEFDQLFFAAPWHLSPVSKSLERYFTEQIPEQEYVTLHVTLLTTREKTPHPAFFGLPPNTNLPGTIITTGATARRNGVPPPCFQSISYHGETFPGSGEWVVKLFSLKELDEYTITTMFGSEPTWLYRKKFKSYPKLRPIAAYAPMQPIPGLHYLAALEPWVSTMETQTLSAREAVANVVQRWWGVGIGECREGGDSWDMVCEG